MDETVTTISRIIRFVTFAPEELEGTSEAVIARFLRHLVSGGAGMLFYMIILVTAVEVLAVHPVAAAVVAFVLLTIFTYLAGRLWVYRPSRGHSYSAPRFLVVVGVAFLLNTAIMFVAVEVFSWWYIWGQVAAALVVPPTNFVLNYFWAFR